MSVGVVNSGTVTKVANGFTSILGAAKEDGVASLGSAEGKLIESNALSTGLGDTISTGLKD